jgi:glycosyltransferase involved in cell wall biosynthesis
MVMKRIRTVLAESKPRRVALLHDCVVYGGLEVYVQLLARYMNKKRYEAFIVVPGYADEFRSSPARFIEEVKESGLNLLRPPFPGSGKIRSNFNELINLTQLLRDNKIDIVHIHTARPHGARKATIATALAGIPIIRTEHLAPSATAKRFDKFTVKPFDFLTKQIITDSDSNLQEQVDLLNRKPAKLYRSYCGIELSRFNPNHDILAAKQKLGLDPQVPLVGAVGRLAEPKGHKYLIAAATKVLKEYGKVNFVLVGDGPLKDELSRQVIEAGIGDYFHFAGFQKEYLPYIEAMDIAVMASIHEGFSLSMLEFMAMGKPCVFTDHSSFKEAIGDSESAVIVPMHSADGLAGGILKLLNDPALAATLGKRALAQVRSEFSIERLTSDMMNLYDAVLEGVNLNSIKELATIIR